MAVEEIINAEAAPMEEEKEEPEVRPSQLSLVGLSCRLVVQGCRRAR
jgi:hypothetical protein